MATKQRTVQRTDAQMRELYYDMERKLANAERTLAICSSDRQIREWSEACAKLEVLLALILERMGAPVERRAYALEVTE